MRNRIFMFDFSNYFSLFLLSWSMDLSFRWLLRFHVQFCEFRSDVSSHQETNPSRCFSWFGYQSIWKFSSLYFGILGRWFSYILKRFFFSNEFVNHGMIGFRWTFNLVTTDFGFPILPRSVGKLSLEIFLLGKYRTDFCNTWAYQRLNRIKLEPAVSIDAYLNFAYIFRLNT